MQVHLFEKKKVAEKTSPISKSRTKKLTKLVFAIPAAKIDEVNMQLMNLVNPALNYATNMYFFLRA